MLFQNNNFSAMNVNCFFLVQIIIQKKYAQRDMGVEYLHI